MPASGATNITAMADPSATFSVPLDATTVTSSTFTLTGPSGAVAATVVYNAPTMTAVLTPSAALASGTTYTAKLTTGVKSAQGTPLASAYTWTFTTISGADLTSATPADQSTGIITNNGSTGPVITAKFNRAMTATSFTTSTVTLKTAAGTSMTSSPAYNSTTGTLTVTPTAPLGYSTTYVLTLTTGVTDSTGTPLAAPISWRFTTTGDAVAPTRINAGGSAYTGSGVTWAADNSFSGGSTLTSTHAITGTSDPTLYQAERVGISTSTTWRYTLWMPPGIYNLNLYFAELTKTGTGQRVFNVTVGSTTVLSNFDIFAAAGGQYAAVEKSFPGIAVTTPAAMRISSSVVTDYPAIAALESIPAPPTAGSPSPGNGATGVSRSAAVTATFGRAMDATSLNAATFTLTGPSGPVVATVSYNSTTNVATLTPSSTLAPNTTYTARLDKSVHDSYGMNMSGAYSWSFTTGS
jgi:hypothetical protein